MKLIVLTAGVRGGKDTVYVTHVDDDVRAHHGFVKIRKALRKLAEQLDGGISSAEDNATTLAFWHGKFHVDLLVEIEDVKLPA